MWYVERSDGKGNWATMMTSPHRVTIGDLEPRNGPYRENQFSGAFFLNESPTPGNKTVFAGLPGMHARVRWNDAVVEEYDWAEIPVNEFDPDTDYLWGWKKFADYTAHVPFEELYPTGVPFPG